MKFLHQIEKTLDQRLRAAFGGGRENSPEAIELYRDVLEEISSRTIPGLRGTPMFPFNRIRIGLKAENSERRAALEALFSPPDLIRDIVTCLGESRASVPPDLAIEVGFRAEQADEMEIAFERADVAPLSEAAKIPEEAPAKSTPPRIAVRLITLAGISSQPEFDLTGNSLHIGRGPDVIDTAGRTVRRNGLFFSEEAELPEAAEINATVSRAHAHLIPDSASGGWRIYDDGSSFGTSIFRHGRRIDVPAHASRGVGLQPGDEIWLGHARLRLDALDREDLAG